MRPLLDVWPIRDVQRGYFDLLRKFFGVPYDIMVGNRLSPAQLAADISTRDSLVNAFYVERLEMAEVFATFWEANRRTMDEYLGAIETMKSFFGGDISPVVDLKHFSSTVLYTDTVVLQCPVLRLAPLMSFTAPKESFRLVVKHALNVMRMEPLAVAEVEPPIILFTESAFGFDEEYQTKLIEASEPYVLAHAEALLGRRFASSADLQEYLVGLEDVSQAVNAITDPSRALFDTEWTGNLSQQIARSVVELKTRFGAPDAIAKVGFSLHNTISGRMLQANETVLLSSTIGAFPLLSAPTSWQYLVWRYEYDAKRTHPEEDFRDLVVTNAIFTRENRGEFPLISGLSVESIVSLRKEGALGSFRGLVRNAMTKIDAASPYDLRAVSREVALELGEALDKHERDLADLSSGKKRFYGIDVASSVATAALTIAGAATGNIPLTTIGAVSTAVLGSKSLAAFKDGWTALRDRENEMKRSPAAMLLRHIG